MQAEQQQLQLGANQSSANCHAADAALEEVQPSQLEQQNESGSEKQPEPNSESDNGLNDGRGKEDRCIAACCSNLPLLSSCNLAGPCIQKDKC